MEKFKYTWDSEEGKVSREHDRYFLKNFGDVDRLVRKQKPIAIIDEALTAALELSKEKDILSVENSWFQVQELIQDSEELQPDAMEIRDYYETQYPHLEGYRGVEDAPARPDTSVTQSDIDQWKLDNYATLRQGEYGSWESQLEEIFDTSLTAWKTRISSIKTKYPKS